MARVLAVGDIRGNHEIVTQAFDKFLREDYDKIIFIGNFADSLTREDKDIIRAFHVALAVKQTYPDRVILLRGQADEAYFHHDAYGYRAKTFRPSLHRALSHILIPKDDSFKHAYNMGNFLFTHGGISLKWFLKHYTTILTWANHMGLDPEEPRDIASLINGIAKTADRKILHEKAATYGGYESDLGGPLWCDKSELMIGPLYGVNQVVGNSPENFIYRFHRFADDKHRENTSVTFIDVLDRRTQFLTLDIKG